jgi:hypothetical protein
MGWFAWAWTWVDRTSARNMIGLIWNFRRLGIVEYFLNKVSTNRGNIDQDRRREQGGHM